MYELKEKFASNLRRIRKQRKVTQKEAAELLGYSEKTVSKWECGAGIPPIETLFNISELFKVSIDDLFKSDSIYCLGIDGGGTKTALALADKDGKILRHLKVGSCNPVDIGFEPATTVLKDAIYEICKGIPFSSVYVFAGISGGTTADMKEKFHNFFSGFNFAGFENDTDNRNIITAGLGNNDGITLILGDRYMCIYSKKQ